MVINQNEESIGIQRNNKYACQWDICACNYFPLASIVLLLLPFANSFGIDRPDEDLNWSIL